jgi:hypothetical protein
MEFIYLNSFFNIGVKYSNFSLINFTLILLKKGGMHSSISSLFLCHLVLLRSSIHFREFQSDLIMQTQAVLVTVKRIQIIPLTEACYIFWCLECDWFDLLLSTLSPSHNPSCRVLVLYSLSFLILLSLPWQCSCFTHLGISTLPGLLASRVF